MIQAGKHRGHPVAAVLSVAGTGREQIAVLFEFTDGQRLTWYGSFTDAAFGITMKALRACGWTGNVLTDFEEGNPLPEEFCNEVELEVEIDNYRGVPEPKIKWVNSGGGLAVKSTLTGVQAKAFANRMKGAILAYDKNGSTPAPKQAPRDDKDIPF